MSEDISPDRTLFRISTQVLQCKAILCGLDVNLQCSRCSAQQREELQPAVVLALKDSVQAATHSLFITFATLAKFGNDSILDSNEVSTLGTSRQPSPSGFSSNGVAMATNVTLSLQNSARMISLPGHHVTTTDGFSPQRDQHGRLSSIGSSHGRRDPSVFSSMSSDWESPFSLPDPLAFDDSKACTILTGRHARPTLMVPKIVVDTCAASEIDNVPVSIFEANNNPPYEISMPASPRGSTQDPEQRCQEIPDTPSAPRMSDHRQTCTMYVPYRPWYKPLDRADSRVDLIRMKESVNGRYEANSTVTGEVASPRTPSAETKTKQFYPPMPKRSPPPPPPPLAARNKRKPSVPPRRRVYLVANSTDPAKQICQVAEASQPSAPLDACVDASPGDGATPMIPTLPFLDELKQVLERNTTPRRRASTGEIHLGAQPDKSVAIGTKHNRGVQQNEKLGSPHFHRSEVRRTRSASAPELTTPKLKSPVFSCLPELAVELPGGFCDTKQPTNNEDNISSQLSEGLDASVMSERIENICDSWNSRNWLKAESYLTYHLNMVKGDQNTTRRIRHLLGVCASYRGQWHRALVLFISVVITPIREIWKIDRGDRAAFYWLGDTYSLMNRREEALLSYCLAGACDQSASASKLPQPHRCLLSDQEQLRQTVSKSSFKAIWADASFRGVHIAKDSILHCTIVTQSVAQECLQASSLAADRCSLHMADIGYIVHDLDDKLASGPLLITPEHFGPSSPWPMPYDPTFDLQSVVQGSLMARQIDIIREIQQSPELLHFRRRFSPNLSGPLCVDLRRLIAALRVSLQTLAMERGEVASSTGVFFLVRYHSVENKVATTNYFRIEVVRLPLRNGYGLNFCSDGSGSARVTSTALKPDGSLDTSTQRALRGCLRAAIDRACTQQRKKADSKLTSLISPPPPPPPSPRPRPPPPPVPPKASTDTSVSAAELESPYSTPQSSVDLSSLVPPPIVTASKPAPSQLQLPPTARARVSVRSSYNELHLLGPLVR
jgi:hypothetical protein